MLFRPGAHGINFFCRFLGWLNLTADFADFADTMGAAAAEVLGYR
jgi:hypothetical protein